MCAHAAQSRENIGNMCHICIVYQMKAANVYRTYLKLFFLASGAEKSISLFIVVS